ncbi:MAG: endolytic transglycosylase MltG [Clostridium sp.]|nr:endolytic transglycosylase MltG [Clostridium sp.]MCI7442898.1 endolytic transglycosylase MltG [Clostridium sp.]
MKKKKGILLLIVLLIIIIIGGFEYYNGIIESPLKSDKEKIKITVDEGESFYSILDKLSSKGVLKNKEVIKLNLKLDKKSNINLVPGEHEINTNVTLKELIKILETEDFSKNRISVTIPEGYDIEEIANLFEENGLFSKDEFLNAVKNHELPNYVKRDNKKKYNLEGYLFPNTYFLDKDISPDEVISLMISEFEKTLEKVEKETGVTVKEEEIEKIITIASLVEEEAELDEERDLVSSVIYNRLEKGMKLEFCSTINYAWGEHLPQVLNKHLEIDSPYNTYKNEGLPVGPITNPGEKSIIAAVKPAQTDYLYFMLLYNQGGKHHFSNNGAEHEKVKHEEEAKARAN